MEEAVQDILSQDLEETSHDTDTSATQPIEPAPSPASLKTVIGQMYDLQETCMSRNDLAHITEALGSLIQKAEKQGQHARTVQSSIADYFRH